MKSECATSGCHVPVEKFNKCLECRRKLAERDASRARTEKQMRSRSRENMRRRFSADEVDALSRVLRHATKSGDDAALLLFLGWVDECLRA